MAETKLKLVKNQKKQTLSNSNAADNHASRITHHAPRTTPLPPLTPAERAEAARFRALTAAKAARQAMISRIMSELQELDEIHPAA
ncbi:MAG: hypothetical protein L6R45_25355 [Anaerolineae bacterium]|nr:hypothetical protein [Anaerolineae bacterium]